MPRRKKRKVLPKETFTASEVDAGLRLIAEGVPAAREALLKAKAAATKSPSDFTVSRVAYWEHVVAGLKWWRNCMYEKYGVPR